ncbi:uncharacterized protein LOC114532964 [Dendronephthya gigantea]|uniref:uncharacterized protein LOC114532964 n=1 Tax=Dendronephthya gigantea TaxID=151771 RepID=UPI00106998AE|nr:uncharacterized protein LOC114532964 [Dendronephthya gigantea]
MAATRLRGSVLLRFGLLLMLFLNFYAFEQRQSLCYEGPKEDHRLNTTVAKYVHALTGGECILFCMRDDESCRAINFNKSSTSEKNCEFLKDTASEMSQDDLHKDEDYDYYTLLSPTRNPPYVSSSAKSIQTTREGQTVSSPTCSNVTKSGSSVKCGENNQHFVKKIFRKPGSEERKLECCSSLLAFSNHSWECDKTTNKITDRKKNKWLNCSENTYLHGLATNEKSGDCCGSPKIGYGSSCHYEKITFKHDKYCSSVDEFIVGFYRMENKIEKLRCCKMVLSA